MSIKKTRYQTIKKFTQAKAKKILIWGFGLTGKSFLEWCLKNQENNFYFIFDKQDIAEIVKEKNVSFHLESEIETYFSFADFILPSPGIKIDQKTFKWYEKIIPELDLFYFLVTKMKTKTVLITGSIGKSSLTTIIHNNLSSIFDSILCGNIGFPVLNFLNQKILIEKTIFCIEASDAQLKHCCLVSPTLFLITNLYQNHLNYHGSIGAYIQAKLTPVKFQEKKIHKIILSNQAYQEIKKFYTFKKKTKLILISDKEDLQRINKNSIYTKNNILYKGKKVILEKIPKISFQINWAFTATILLHFFKKIKIEKSIASNIILPSYRLAKIFNSEKLEIFNDSKSTIMEATLAGLMQLKKIYNENTHFFILIGGLSKGVDRSQGIQNILALENTHITIFGKEMDELKNSLKEQKTLSYEEKLEEALPKILSATKQYNKSIILFSPGGASFDQFTSFEDRGKYFNELTLKLIALY